MVLTPQSPIVLIGFFAMMSSALVTPCSPSATKAVSIGTADHARLRAERERAHHVHAGVDAAVEHDLEPRADLVDDLRQHFNRGRRAVELAAMV